MLIISVGDNENNGWKRNAKTKKKAKKKTKQQQQQQKGRKEQGGTKAIVKGWDLNDFVVELS